MAELKVEVDPAEVGFDAGRLARIDRHFARYVDDGRLPGWLILVSRAGKVTYLATYGHRDREKGLAVETDTLFRIYSMTKPITSVAAMMLYEEGAFELSDPVSRFIPAFSDARVYRSGPPEDPVTEPAVEPVRIWHLLTHTSGLTYGNADHPVDAMYRAAGFGRGGGALGDLAARCDRWAGLPLLFEPGTGWNYSVSTDVLGRVVEVVSGQPLDRFFEERILGPLGMTDTGFWVQPSDADRLAAFYGADPESCLAVRDDDRGAAALRPPPFFSGGGGLVSSAPDYHRFTELLCNGGELEGIRLLGSRTVSYMGRNHLPGGADLYQVGRPPQGGSPAVRGVGFGLGLSVVLDPVEAKVLSPGGEMAWGGVASTAFWVDRKEGITVLFLTQLQPSTTHPIRPQLKQLVYQALAD
jgi:CubicO group peptidase (beta-lactamase class C family)